MALGASSWIPEGFQIDTSVAFQGNFSIAKAQRAVLGSSRLRSLVYAAFALSGKFCASRQSDDLFFFASFAEPSRTLRSRAFELADKPFLQLLTAKFAKVSQSSLKMSREGSNRRALIEKTIVECMVMFAIRACATAFFVTAALLFASAQHQ